MAEEVKIVIDVDSKDGGKSIKEVKDNIKGLEKEAKSVKEQLTAIEDGVRNIDKASALTKSKKSFEDLNNLVDNSVLAWQELGPAIDSYKSIAQAAGLESPIGKEALQRAAQLTDQAGDLSAKINNLASDTRGLDAAMGVGQGIAGGFQAAQGAMALFGSESEEVNKAIKNVIAVQGVMNGVQQVTNVLQNESALGQLLQTKRIITYIKTSKAAIVVQKLFNFVVKKNPLIFIGTVISGVIGYLITFTDKLEGAGNAFTKIGAKVSEIIDWFGKWKYVVLALLGPIGLLIGAWDYFFGEQTKNSAAEIKRQEEKNKRDREANAEITKQHKARLSQIAEQREEERKAFKKKDAQYDREIARMEAEGKNAFALRKIKQEAVLQEVQDQINAINKIEEAWTIYYENQLARSGKSREDFLEQLKAQGIDIVALQSQLNERRKKLSNDLFDEETKLIALKTSNRKESNEREITEEMTKMQTISEGRLEIEGREIDSRAEMRAMANEIEVLSEEEHQELLTSIAKTAAEDRATAINEAANNIESKAQKSLKVISDLNTLFHGKELARIKEKRSAGEKLTENEIKRLKQEDAIRKASALVQIASDTARGISAAIAAGAGLIFPANLGAIAAGVSAVIAGAAQASQVLGESVDIGSATGVEEQAEEPEINNVEPQFTPRGFGSSLLDQPQRVFVVESDITDTQGKVNVLEQQATFG